MRLIFKTNDFQFIYEILMFCFSVLFIDRRNVMTVISVIAIAFGVGLQWRYFPRLNGREPLILIGRHRYQYSTVFYLTQQL